MKLILDRTFETSDFLTWYHQARAGESCIVIVPAMQDWHLLITKTAEDDHLLLDPDGKCPGLIALDNLLHMFDSMHRAMVTRAK